MGRDVFVMTEAVREHRANALLHYLRDNADRAVPAIELALHLQIGGDRESKRRIVRKLIEHMHERGTRICADFSSKSGGYWIARNDREWRDYRVSREIHARFEFVALRKMKTAAMERQSGQAVLAGMGQD